MEENTLNNLKYIGYARKSSEDNRDRQVASLDDQVFIIEGVKTRYNLNIVEVLQESKSAHEKGRELFEVMINKLEIGEANAILTWHLNRLARNMIDGGKIIDLIDRNRLVEIKTPSRAYHNTPEDKFMLSLEFSISKKDSDDKSIAVTRGLEKKARDGFRPGVAPQGYLNDKNTESGNRRILVDSERFGFVKQIFELFQNGISVNEIHRLAKDDWGFRTRIKKRSGGKPLSISMIYHILTNPFYCGKFEYPVKSGKWYNGNYEAVISEEIFNEIQIKLGKRSQYKLQGHQFAYTGSLVHCASCDSAIVGEEKWQCICSNCKEKFSITKKNKDRCTHCGKLILNMTSPKMLHYTYYRCGKKKNPQCTEKSVSLTKLEEQINEFLTGVDISPAFMEWAIKQILKENTEERNFREDAIKSIKSTHDDVRIQLDNLLHLKISPMNKNGEVLSDEEYKNKKTKLEIELKGLEKQLVDTDSRMIQANDQTEKAFTFASRAKERFAGDDLKVKRDIFMGLGLHLTLHDRKVQFDSPKYLFKIKEMRKVTPIIAKRVEPKKEPENQTLLEEKFSSIPYLLRSWELNPVCKIMSLTCSRTLPRT